MKYLSFLRVGFLARQALVAWLILFIGAVLFATLSVILVLITQNETLSLFIALLITSALLITAHVFSFLNNYRLPNNNYAYRQYQQQLEELLRLGAFSSTEESTLKTAYFLHEINLLQKKKALETKMRFFIGLSTTVISIFSLGLAIFGLISKQPQVRVLIALITLAIDLLSIQWIIQQKKAIRRAEFYLKELLEINNLQYLFEMMKSSVDQATRDKLEADAMQKAKFIIQKSKS